MLFPPLASDAPARRFVVLRHDWNGTHWDLMIERELGGALATWGVDREIAPGSPLPARKLGDHRRHYLTHEGEVSGNRGVVTRVDEGTCRILAERPDEIRVEFEGRYLAGLASLRATSDAGWLLELDPPSR